MLSREELLKVALLARLTVSESELEELHRNVNSILEYVAQLDRVDTTDVEPMSHVHGITNVFRDDVVHELLTTDEALQNSPDRSGNYIRVPLVIEQGTEH